MMVDGGLQATAIIITAKISNVKSETHECPF
jgi:hypothetical protein